MERKRLLFFSAAVLAAGWIASDAGSALAQSKSKDNSFGGTQSERTPDSDTPLPSKSPMGGAMEKGDGASKSGKGTRQTKDKSFGGTQSERTPDSDTPLPSKSPMSGESGGSKGDQGKTSSGTKSQKKGSPDVSSPDTSKGGTQSERTGPSGTPVPEGSPFGDRKSAK